MQIATRNVGEEDENETNPNFQINTVFIHPLRDYTSNLKAY